MGHNIKQPDHICHVILRLDIGGLERVVVNLINAMPDNIQHTIICIEYATDFDTLLNKDVNIIELNKSSGREFKTHWKILKWLFNNRPSVVHTYNLPTIEYQSLAWLTRVPVRIHAEHGREMDDISGVNKKQNLLRRLSLPFTTKVVSVSDDLTHWLKTTLKVKDHKISYIANGIDTDVFCKNNVLKKGFLIGAVGRIDDVKNHQFLIQLVESLQENNPDIFESISVEIVGDGPNLSKLQSIVSLKNLDDKIKFTGKSLDVVAKLRTFSLFIQPSYYEAMPMTVLEAMACQLPIISSDVGGVAKVISHEKNGLLFNVNSIDELVDHVVEMYSNNKKREYLAVNARKDVVCNYSCLVMAENYKKLYKVEC